MTQKFILFLRFSLLQYGLPLIVEVEIWVAINIVVDGFRFLYAQAQGSGYETVLQAIL